MASVIVVGGGKVGSHLAALLIESGHAVRIVETAEDRAVELTARFGPDTVTIGSGSDAIVLELAGVRNCDVVAAVTGADETNLAVTGLALWFAFRDVSWRELGAQLAHADWPLLLGASLPAYLWSVQLRAQRWRGASASSSMVLKKSSAETVPPSDHELKSSVPPLSWLMVPPGIRDTLLRSVWSDSPTSASML